MTETSPRKRGRPPLEATGRNPDGRSPEVTASLAPSTRAQVYALAAAREVSVGSVVRDAVVDYLRARTSPAPPPPSAPAPSPAPPPAAAPAASPVPRHGTSVVTGPRASRRVVRAGV